jgi:hypothetical protein
MTFRPDLDERTCPVCDDRVSAAVRGYLTSLRGCERHLAEWHESPEHLEVVTQSAARGTPIGHGPFEAWAAKRRATMPRAREEA